MTPTSNVGQQFLAGTRNEEFSEIAVINIFFTVLKTKTQLSVGEGGSCGENFEISHAIDM